MIKTVDNTKRDVILITTHRQTGRQAMKLTLRKANAVQAAINEAVKARDLTTRVELNEFEEVQDQIQAARDRFWDNATARNSLVTALYEIRARVAQANAAAGINDMLANVAYLDKQIGFNNGLSREGAQTALRVLNGQVKKNAESKDDAYRYGLREVSTSIFTEEEIETFRKNVANFKREKQRLQDRLLELNVQTEIALTETTAEFLKSVDIL